MLNTKMQELGENRSVIRDLFEYGKKETPVFPRLTR